MKTYAIFDDSFFQNKPWWMPKKLHNVVSIRANPRSQEYMLELLQEHFPEATIIDIDSPHENGQLFLLYPDSIGLGWGVLERKLLKNFKDIKVLNGRKRSFPFKSLIQFNLILRRFLEITFLPEIVLAPFLVMYGALLAVKDRIAGHR